MVIIYILVSFQLPDLGSALANALLSTTPSPMPQPATPSTPEVKQESPIKTDRKLSETIDVVGTPGTPNVSRILSFLLYIVVLLKCSQFSDSWEILKKDTP